MEDLKLKRETLLSGLEAMRLREGEYRWCADDYIRRRKCPNSSSSEKVVMGLNQVVDFRTNIINWFNNMCDRCGFDQTTVFTAVNTLDRFMAVGGHTVDSNKGSFSFYLLAAAASFYTIAKIHEHSAVPVEVLAKLSGGSFTVDQIESMERKLLSTLGWIVNPVTPQAVAHHLLSLWSFDNLKVQQVVSELTTLQLDAVVYDYDLCRCSSSSTLAASALWNAVDSLALEDPEPLNRFFHVLETAMGWEFLLPSNRCNRSTEKNAISALEQVRQRLYEVFSHREAQSSGKTASAATMTPPTPLSMPSGDNSCLHGDETHSPDKDLRIVMEKSSPKSVLVEAASMDC